MRIRSPLEITRSVIFALILREMRGRFGRVRLGAYWVLLEPLAHLCAIGAIMTMRGRSAPGHDFLVFLLMGLSPFLLFKNITLKLMGGVEANKSLFAYKQIQPFDAFAARAIVEFCIAAMVFLIIYTALTWYGLDTRIFHPIEWLFVLTLGIIFSFSLGIIFSIIAEEIPESKLILRLIFMPLYFLSGIIFSIQQMPAKYMEYLLWNPYLHIIDLLRASTFQYYRLLNGVSIEFVIKVTVVTTFLALVAYRARKFRLMSL